MSDKGSCSRISVRWDTNYIHRKRKLVPCFVLICILELDWLFGMTDGRYFRTGWIAQSAYQLRYGLDDSGIVVRFLVEAWDFSPIHNVQTGWGPHPAPYMMNTGRCFHGVKYKEREADHSPRSSAEVKEWWNYTSAPPYIFEAWFLLKPRDNYLYLQKRILQYIWKRTTAMVCKVLVTRNIAVCWGSEQSICFSYHNYWFKING
jgi:hypothetical protein